MIIWSGWGALSALIIGVSFIGGVVLDLQLGKAGIPTPTGVVLVWLAGAALNWVVGRRLNGRPGREMIDARTGERVLLVPNHTLFWIPMQYYTFLMLLLGALAALASLNHTPRPPV